MPPRTAAQILAEWHELAMRRDEATDDDLAEGLAARIEQVRREYIEGTPPATTSAPSTVVDNEPKIQMKLPL
jgi:hypothetical protein